MNNKAKGLALTLVMICGCDYAVHLPNNYSLNRVSRGSGIITKRDSNQVDQIAVPPGVIAYGVSSNLVFGHVTISPQDKPRWSDGTAFILDTTSGHVEILQTNILRETLSRRGIQTDFRLKPVD